MNIVNKLIISLILISSLCSSKTKNELLKIISNKKHKLEYFFFIKDYKAFLVKETITNTDKSTYGVWHYTRTRQWEPISNALGDFQFDPAINHFNKIAIDKINKTISFGDIINYNNKLPSSLSTNKKNINYITKDMLSLLQIIENKTISIGWYFWIKNNESFLFSGDNEKGINIWHYTNKRKWKPLYNTSEFDGFEKAGDTLKDVEFNTSANGDTFFISAGDIIPQTRDVKDAFILTVKTDKTDIIPSFSRTKKTSYVISGNTQYTILADPSYNYNYDYSVDCNNDGIYEAKHLSKNYTCEYEQAGEYDVAIYGIYPSRGILRQDSHSIYSDNGKILNIKQWGSIKWENMENSFAYNDKMIISAKDIPNFSRVKSMYAMFDYTFINQNLSNWDVSSVESTNQMFSHSLFNQDISKWDMSSNKNMFGMFLRSSFNQDISKWDISNVKYMGSMFYEATKFNQDLTKWKIKDGTETRNMFKGATSMEEKNKPKGI